MFVTHASVRIRGTENNYCPVPCNDPLCLNKHPHLHCPFCQKGELFHDPVILKAHYRVKHVDKGIDFAGLKILRCCDLCDIVGAIKGEKKFKGAHWHCYKCKNGFNRRDEAIKHYRTHFRNPQTTFQIQVTQEVNNPVPVIENHEEIQTISHDGISTTIHPVFTEAILSTVTNPSNSPNNENDSSVANSNEPEQIHVSVAANETVGVSETQAIMIIHEEQIDNSPTITSSPESTCSSDKFQTDKKIFELKEAMKKKELEHAQKENKLVAEIHQLKMQVHLQSKEIEHLRKREEDLVQQIQMPNSLKIQDLISSLQAQHFDLLQQHLVEIQRATFYNIIKTESQESLSDDNSSEKLLNSPEVVSPNSNQTVVALVMDRMGGLVRLNQPMFAASGLTPIELTSACSVELSPTVEVVEESKPFDPSAERPKTPESSLVIVDILSSEDLKKREAEEPMKLDVEVKRKK